MNKKDILGKMRLLPLFAIFIFAGCTLMMEGEEELAPEEKGFDEPVTEENEYATITYQYQDGVKPVTDNVLDYVVESDDPNFLYFLDNIPSKWVPKVGEYLAGGCNPKIPEGLCNKVVGVTHENGMYKIELAPATEDEVYKELEISVDFDYVVPDMDLVPDIDSTMTEEEKKAAVYDDWSLFGTDEEIKERYGVKNFRRNAIKRKDSDNITNEDVTETKKTFDFKIDSRPGKLDKKESKGWSKLIKDKLSSWTKKLGLQCEPYFGFSYVRSDVMHHHTYHNKSAKIDTLWSEITPTNDMYLELGMEFNGKKLPYTNEAGHFADTKTLYKYYNDKIQNTFHKKGITSPVVGCERDAKGAIRIMIPGCAAVRIVFEPSIEPILSIGGCAGGHIKCTGETWREGTAQNGKIKKEIKKLISSGKIDVSEFFINGYVKAGVNARIGLGAEIARSITTTIGLGAEATIELGAETSTDGETGPFLVGIDSRDYFSMPLYARAAIRCYLDLQIVFSAAGLFDLWSDRAELGAWNIFKHEKSVNPDVQIGTAPGYLIVPSVLSDEYKGNIQYHYEYEIKNPGDGIFSGNYIPKVKVYDKDKKYLFDLNANGFEDNIAKPLQKKTYIFDKTLSVYKSSIPYPISQYETYFVPYLYRPGDDSYLYASLATKVKQSSPGLLSHGIKQTYGGPMKKERAKVYGLATDEFDFSNERGQYTDFYEYRFNVDFKVENGSLMKYLNTHVKLIQYNGVTENVLYDKNIKKTSPKSGKYTYDIAFGVDKKTAEKKDQLLYVLLDFNIKSITDDDSSVEILTETAMLKNGVDNNPGKSDYGKVESIVF